jgi:hypothetical protein
VSGGHGAAVFTTAGAGGNRVLSGQEPCPLVRPAQGSWSAERDLMDEIDRRTEEPSGAVRLIFLFDGDDIRLLSRQVVDVAVPPADPPKASPRRGFCVEVRSGSEDVLYRRVMTDPAHIDPEVFSDGGSGRGRSPESPPVGAFTVLVPNDGTASHVVLIGAPPPREIARFPMHDPGTPAG